jgi:undecaprenyl-diphosphatase
LRPPQKTIRMNIRNAHPLEWISRWDHLLCLQCNRASRCVWIRRLLGGASRLGDGIFWYALWLVLLLRFGTDAVQAVVHMISTGLVCGAIYKILKAHTLRPRPYQAHSEITLFAVPLDQFSFPSGHTLHAVAFSMVAVSYYPWLVWLVLPFTLLVAVSRVILGLHYPSDVLVGAAIGAMVAMITISLLI